MNAFFVVRAYQGRQSYSIEHWDQSERYTKEERLRILYRVGLTLEEVRLGLDALIHAYEMGVRKKAKVEHADGQEIDWRARLIETLQKKRDVRPWAYEEKSHV